MDPTDPTQSASTRFDAARPPGALDIGSIPLIRRRYDVGALIGSGGFGRVFAGYDRVLAREVAIKFLPVESDDALHRLQRESGALRLLDLSGVVRLFDSGDHEGTAWIVMELVHGLPFPGEAGPLSWSTLEPVAIELLRALEHVHRAGFVHGDLKPVNVLVRSDGSPAILDLGLARPIAGAGASVAVPAATDAETAAGSGAEPVFAGTPRYMAPEQLRGQPASSRSDLYAVGLMLWRALAAEWPHDSLGMERSLSARLDHDAPSIAARCPGIPARVASIIDSMIERDPENRPTSALQCIDGIAAHESVDMERVSRREELARRFRGPERLLHIPSEAAGLLWDRCAGDPGRIRSTLETWVSLGVARGAGDGLTVSRSTLDRLVAGWVPESPRGGAIHAAAPGSPLDLCALISHRDDRQATTAALETARTEQSKGSLSAAAVCLVEGLRASWRTGDLEQEGRLIFAIVELALLDRSLPAIDGAIDAIGRSRVRNDDALELLHAVRALQHGKRAEALSLLREPGDEEPLALQRGWQELRVQAAVDGPFDRANLDATRRDIDRWAG